MGGVEGVGVDSCEVCEGGIDVLGGEGMDTSRV